MMAEKKVRGEQKDREKREEEKKEKGYEKKIQNMRILNIF